MTVLQLMALIKHISLNIKK